MLNLTCQKCGKDSLSQKSVYGSFVVVHEPMKWGVDWEGKFPKEIRNQNKSYFDELKREKLKKVVLEAQKEKKDVCNNCWAIYEGDLNSEIQEIQRRNEQYDILITKLKAEEDYLVDQNEISHQQDLDNEEIFQLERELIGLQDKLQHSIMEHKAIENKCKEITKKEAKYWHSYFSQQKILQESRLDTLLRSRTKKELENEISRLKRKTMLQRMFRIEFVHPYAMINGLRLGMLEDADFGWDEVNAAIGYVALIIQIVSQTKKINIAPFKILARASRTCIENIETAEIHKLYFEKKRNIQSFNRGLKGLVFCIKKIFDVNIHKPKYETIQSKLKDISLNLSNFSAQELTNWNNSMIRLAAVLLHIIRPDY